MEDTTNLITAITGLIDSLSRFLDSHGTVAYFGTLGFALSFFAIYTIGKMIINVYSGEIDRVAESRNRVHERLLEDRKTSKINKEKEKDQ